MRRRAEFRPFGWLYDLRQREQLDLDPPYQRRSVWPERYKIDFVTTVLLDYPCPAIFLYEEIRTNGSFFYKVVDGKQRLMSLFEFIEGDFPVSEHHPNTEIRGQFFKNLDDAAKLVIWRYSFSVEFIEQENESLINDIFNRINRNVAKLTPQELRHAQFSGDFISACEDVASEMEIILPSNFPNIASQSRRQMKDVENIATMFLFLEQGERSLSQSDLDRAFSERDDEWINKEIVVREFRDAIYYISSTLDYSRNSYISSSRLRNQADFYSLFGAIVELKREGKLPTPYVAAERLSHWLGRIKEVESSGDIQQLASTEMIYLSAARAASNDAGPRRVRINALKEVLTDD